MAEHPNKPALSDSDPSLQLGSIADRAVNGLAALGVVALVTAGVLGLSAHDHGRHFMFAYLVAFAWVLSIGLGALWWVTLQHLVNARWSIVVRRLGELLAANAPILALLALPLVIPTLLGNHELFPWVDHELMHSNHVLHKKAGYLNVGFFTVRMALYFGFWSWWSRHLLARSVSQDKNTATLGLLERVRGASAPGMIAMAFTITFAAIDLLMSLDPLWFSTIYGVYYFAGCVIAVHAVMVLFTLWFQSKGRLTAVTREHFHDLGKMLFAFTVFWAYIAFSQFMLIWYANIPEETGFFMERIHGNWLHVSYFLIVGHFVLPFFGLLSRHVKRHRVGLAFWSVWMLVVHYVDLHWLIMPNYQHEHASFGLLELTCWVGLASLLAAATLRRAKGKNLVPVGDARLSASMAFENV